MLMCPGAAVLASPEGKHRGVARASEEETVFRDPQILCSFIPSSEIYQAPSLCQAPFQALGMWL